MPFQEALPLKPSEITIKGATVGNWTKQITDIVRSQELPASQEDRQYVIFGHLAIFVS